MSLVIREMQIKTTLRFYLAPIRIAKIKTSGDNTCWRGCGERGNLLCCRWDCKLVQPLGKSIWQFLRKLGIARYLKTLLYHSWEYTQKYAVPYHRVTSSTMFIVALFVIARSWKQPRCPTTEEWIQKMWFIYTMEYYSAIKNKDILTFAGKWVELENIILNEVTRPRKTHTVCTHLEVNISHKVHDNHAIIHHKP